MARVRVSVRSDHPLDECTFVINGTYPFIGVSSSEQDGKPAASKSKAVSSSSPAPPALTLHSPMTDRSILNGRPRVQSPSWRVPRIKQSENIRAKPVSNSIDVIPEQPEEACVVSGRVDITRNWFGYLGVFDLRKSDSTSATLTSPARLYYRVVYPSGRVPVSLLFYLSDQVRALNVRMNCNQRVQVIDQRGPQIIRLDPASPHSGCVSRSRSPDDEISHVDQHTSPGADSSAMIDCRGGRVLRSNIDRQWNIAVSSCGAPRGLTLAYTLAVYGHKGRCPPSPGMMSGTDDISKYFSLVSMATCLATVLIAAALRSAL